MATINGSAGQWISDGPVGSGSTGGASTVNSSTNSTSNNNGAFITLSDVSQPQVLPQASVGHSASLQIL